MEFTDEQKKILDHDPNKHACILAGPGTGKSSTIISYISNVRKNHPNKMIRLLTFTRAANRELMDKIIEAGHNSVVSSTIHSFAISVLLKNHGTSGLPEPLRIADDWEWKELIKNDIARILNTKSSYIEKLKHEMSASWESLSPQEDPNVPPEIRARFMGLWEEHRRIFGYTLLSELPFRLKIALEGNTNLELGNLELVAVDEYQDLNACDLNCFNLLMQRGITVLAIGDDDQSIYQFRKAHPAGIRNFSSDYQTLTYPLTISHRCGKKILEWANFVIAGDTGRLAKPSLKPSVENSDGFVGYLVFNRESSEADGIVRLVNWLANEQQISYEEILILVRTGVIAKLIKQSFRNASIPFADPEDYLNILKDKRTRYLLSILRLLKNKSDSLTWWTVLKLTDGIGVKTIVKLYDLARQNNKQFGEIMLSEANNNFLALSSEKNKIEKAVRSVLDSIVKIQIPEDIRWGTWLVEQIKSGNLPKPAEGFDLLLEKIDDEKENESLGFAQYINQIEPKIKDIMNSKIPSRVRIMTLSRSKGLTVRATIIAGVEKEIIPHPRAYDYQEERRLLYVGMTRSREFLFLTRCRRRTGQTARSGKANVAGTRTGCPFLDGGPVNQVDGGEFLKKLSI